MTTAASYIPAKQTARAELAAHMAEFERRATVKQIPTGVETGIRFRAFALKGTPEGKRK